MIPFVLLCVLAADDMTLFESMRLLDQMPISRGAKDAMKVTAFRAGSAKQARENRQFRAREEAVKSAVPVVVRFTPGKSPLARRVAVRFVNENGEPVPYLHVEATLRGRSQVKGAVKDVSVKVASRQADRLGRVVVPVDRTDFSQLIVSITGNSKSRWDFQDSEYGLRILPSGNSELPPVKVKRQTVMFRFMDVPAGTILETMDGRTEGQANSTTAKTVEIRESLSDGSTIELSNETVNDTDAQLLLTRRVGQVEFATSLSIKDIGSSQVSHSLPVSLSNLPWRINRLPGLSEFMLAAFQRPELIARPARDVLGVAGLMSLNDVSQVVDPGSRRRIEQALARPGLTRQIKDLSGSFEFLLRSVPAASTGADRASTLIVVEGLRILTEQTNFVGIKVGFDASEVEKVLGPPESRLLDGTWSYLDQGIEVAWRGSKVSAISLWRPIQFLAEGLRPSSGKPVFESRLRSEVKAGSNSNRLGQMVLDRVIKQLIEEGSARPADPTSRELPNYRLEVRPTLYTETLADSDFLSQLTFGVSLMDSLGFRQRTQESVEIANTLHRTGKLDEAELVSEGVRSFSTYLRLKLMTGRVTSVDAVTGVATIEVSSFVGLLPGTTFLVRNFDRPAFPEGYALQVYEIDTARRAARCKIVRFRRESRPFGEDVVSPVDVRLEEQRRLIGQMLDTRTGLVYVDFQRFGSK